MKPIISVIIPMYNASVYIKACIMSLLNQTFTDFEIIIVDDGSSDNSYSICKNDFLTESRVRLFHQENKGVSSARAYGVRKAEGDYIFFVDADDTVKNNMLEVLYHKIIEGYDMVMSESPFEGEFLGQEFVSFILEQRISVCIWGKLIRRKFLTSKTMNLPAEINVGEDLALNVKIGLLMNKVYLLAENFYNYQYNPNSVMANRKITLDYEIIFHHLIRNILDDKINQYFYSYKLLQLSSLKELVLAKAKIDYSTDWIYDLVNNSRSIRLNREQWILVHIRNPFVCRIILSFESKINSLIRRFK